MMTRQFLGTDSALPPLGWFGDAVLPPGVDWTLAEVMFTGPKSAVPSCQGAAAPRVSP